MKKTSDSIKKNKRQGRRRQRDCGKIFRAIQGSLYRKIHSPWGGGDYQLMSFGGKNMKRGRKKGANVKKKKKGERKRKRKKGEEKKK